MVKTPTLDITAAATPAATYVTFSFQALHNPMHIVSEVATLTKVLGESLKMLFSSVN